MSIAEEYIPEDEYTGLSSNDDQVYDADDTSLLLNDEVEVSIQEEIPLAEDESENSTLEELEILYNASTEATAAESECIQDDDVPVLPELEAMYGPSDESTGESVLQELEAMLSDDSVEPVVNSITDEVEIPEATEYSANESESSGMSALDELKDFLGETVPAEDGESEDAPASYDDYSIESRKSVLDELQNLLQSCINELKATAEGDSASSILSTDVDYPSHYELKNLLETKLSQLIKISDDSASPDYVADGMSVLDELSDMLGGEEIEVDNSADVSDTSVSLDGVDEYLSSLELDDESSADETVATDSVLDELKELLGESFDMEAEIPVSSSASDYSTADEAPLLDTLEDMLSGAGETEDSELLQDNSTVSVTGTGDSEKKEISVLEEYAAYMNGSSELLDIVSANQAEATETETESAFEEGDSTSDTLQQLEAMLNKSSASTDDETSKTTQLIEDDVSIEYETPQLSDRNEEEKHEDSSELNNRAAAAELTAEGQIQNSLHEAEIDNRLPVVGMSLLAAAVIGVIVFWNMSGDQHSQANYSPAKQSPSLVKPVTVKAEPEPFAPPAIVETKVELPAPEEVQVVTPVLPENTGNINDSPATVERSEDGTEASYENETYDSYENKQYELDEEPVQYNIDEPLNNEVTDSGLEMDVLQIEQAEAAYETAENRLKELIVEQEKQQDNNEESLNLLNERVVETEASISKLKLAVEKYKQLESVQSVSSITSEMNAIHTSKLAAGDLPDQTYTIWSVHLLSFYGKPPPAGELDFLDAAGVPYKIKKAIVNGGVWYRVLVNNSTEYSAAKEYAGMLEERLGMKKIWISKKQYAYE